jgi:hypothetical protein
MKTVNFKTFTVTTNVEEKDFFEEGLIHNELDMLSVVDARAHYEKLFNEDPFFNHNPKDITYVFGLYQKLEEFSMENIDFDKLEKSIISHSHGECQPVWLHWDGCITELFGKNFDLPYDEDQPTNPVNPVVAVFTSFTSDYVIRYENTGNRIGWEKHIKKTIESKMIEIEAEHLENR